MLLSVLELRLLLPFRSRSHKELIIAISFGVACSFVFFSHAFKNQGIDFVEEDDHTDVLSEMVKGHKEEILKKLTSPYHVSFVASGNLLAKLGHLHSVSKENLACKLKSLHLSSPVDATSPPFTKSHPQAHLFPRRKFLDGKKFKTCAVVSNAGTLRGSGLGTFIDSHDIVVRMNGAVTAGYEEDVGSRTTVQIVNHMVVHFNGTGFKPGDFNSTGSESPSTLLVESVCETMDRSYLECFLNETSSQIKIQPNVESSFTFDTLIRYFERRKLHPEEDIHIMDFSLPQKIWHFLQEFSPQPIPINSPSTGILGLLAMLDICNTVNAFEFIPSVRDANETKCHYWNDTFLQETFPSEVNNCTFLEYHPMKTEKLLLLRLNTGSDEQVFQKGFVSMKGLNGFNCDDVE